MKQSDARNWSMYPHFKKQEFACKDKCGFMDENLKVVEILEEIRSHFGNKPVIITSGCRCVKRNNRVRRNKTEANIYLEKPQTSM